MAFLPRDPQAITRTTTDPFGFPLSRRSSTDPCLYLWWRGDRVLYVGISVRQSYGRPTANHHSEQPWVDPRLPTDRVEILPRPGATLAELLEEERDLIESYLPAQNIYKHPHRKRRARTKTTAQSQSQTFEQWVESWRTGLGTNRG